MAVAEDRVMWAQWAWLNDPVPIWAALLGIAFFGKWVWNVATANDRLKDEVEKLKMRDDDQPPSMPGGG